jgi:hypothetical protein
MIRYDKTLLDNTYLVEEAHELNKSGFIESEQYKSIKSGLATLKSQNNLLLKLAFFFLGYLLFFSICGMISLLGMNSFGNENTITIFLLVFSAIGFLAKEFMSRELKYFGYGLDDAFILGGHLFLVIAVNIITEVNYQENYLVIFITMAIVSSISYLRYLHVSLALLACIGFTGSLALFLIDFITIGQSILPFAMMLLAGLIYFFSNKTLKKLSSPYYYSGLKLVKGFCLILFCLAGNYLVVRELNHLIAYDYYHNGPSAEIPFALLFWAFTITIPVIYLFFSLKNKDRMMLWIGFLALCFTIFTIRMYHHVLPPEVALTIGGLVLFVFTYFAIKKTKHKETGITFKADRFSDPNAFANLQTLVVASQFGLKPEAKPEESPMKFGGGGFSGGGSNGEF